MEELEELTEVIEEENSIEEEEFSSTSEENDPTQEEVTDEKLSDPADSLSNEELFAIREIISSEDISPETVSGNSIDYSSDLISIKNELVAINSRLVSIQEQSNETLFDRSLNDFSVDQALLSLIVIFLFIDIIMEFIKKFTPKIWR